MSSKYSDASVRTSKKSSPTFRNDDVYVSKSNFLKKNGVDGYGLYASRPYYTGDVIQEYTGIKISLEEATNKKTHKNYFFEIKANGKIVCIIDAANASRSSPARYVNTIRYAHEERYRNTTFVQYQQKIYLVAIKPIKRDSELIAYYGKFTENIIAM